MSAISSPTVPAKPRASASALKQIRKIHLYFGLFIAPALLFFAFTGAMQTLSLHEAADDTYHPPKLIAELGSLHKDQTFAVPHHGGPPPPPETPAAAPKTKAPDQGPPRPPETLGSKIREHLPMKIFFLLVTIGLFTSTLTGIYMAFKYERRPMLVSGVLLAGLIIPLLLLQL